MFKNLKKPKPVTPIEVERHLAPSYEDTVANINAQLMSGGRQYSVFDLSIYIDRLIADFKEAGWEVRLINDDYGVGSRPSHLVFFRYPSVDEDPLENEKTRGKS